MSGIAFIAIGLLESLRAYPRWLVLLCVAVVVGGLIAVVAKPLKWALYLGLIGVFTIFMALFAWWLGA